MHLFFQLAKTHEELVAKISDQSSEILNSVEDMKQLASSVPNGLHDLLPKIDKIGAEVSYALLCSIHFTLSGP